MATHSSKQIKKALGWSFTESVVNRGFSMLVRLYLARLLVPEVFGLVAMAIVFIAFLQITGEMGMTAALIQRKAERLTETHWRTGFTVSFSISALGWIVILFALAPFAAFFYGEPALKQILPILGFALITDSLAIVQKAKLTKALRFKALCVASTIAVLISSALGIYMAYLGYGVWALVAKTLSNSVVRSFLFSVFAGWIPKFGFAKAAFKDLFGFSAYVMIEQFMGFLTGNIDRLLIGKLLGSAALGVYGLAFVLTDTIRLQIMHTFSKVFFPVYANLQDDKELSRAYYLKVIRYTSMVIMPLMALLFLNAEPIILLIFGDAWQAAIVPLRLLAVACVVHAAGGTAASLLRGAGHVRLMMRITFFRTLVVTVPCIVLGAMWGGINGVAWGILISKSTSRTITQFFIKRIFHISEIDILIAVIPSLLAFPAVYVLHIILEYALEPTLVALCLQFALEFLLFGLIFLPIIFATLRGKTKMRSVSAVGTNQSEHIRPWKL